MALKIVATGNTVTVSYGKTEVCKIELTETKMPTIEGVPDAVIIRGSVIRPKGGLADGFVVPVPAAESDAKTAIEKTVAHSSELITGDK